MKIYNAIHSKKMQWSNQPVDNRDLTLQGMATEDTETRIDQR